MHHCHPTPQCSTGYILRACTVIKAICEEADAKHCDRHSTVPYELTRTNYTVLIRSAGPYQRTAEEPQQERHPMGEGTVCSQLLAHTNLVPEGLQTGVLVGHGLALELAPPGQKALQVAFDLTAAPGAQAAAPFAGERSKQLFPIEPGTVLPGQMGVAPSSPYVTGAPTR